MTQGKDKMPQATPLTMQSMESQLKFSTDEQDTKSLYQTSVE